MYISRENILALAIIVVSKFGHFKTPQDNKLMLMLWRGRDLSWRGSTKTSRQVKLQAHACCLNIPFMGFDRCLKTLKP